MAGADLSIGAPDEPEVAVAPEFDDDLPGFDEVLLEEEAPQVDESIVRGLLASFGGALNIAVGDDDVPDHWRFTPREIDDLAPPLTRYINGRPKLRRAVARGDELAIGVALASYVGRNVTDQQKARAAREDDDHDELDGEADRDPSPARAADRGAPQHFRRWDGSADGAGVHPAPGGGQG